MTTEKNRRVSSEDRLEQAKHWSLRLSSEDVDAKTIEAFKSWRDEHPANAETFFQVDRVWQGMQQMTHLKAHARIPKATSGVVRRGWPNWLSSRLNPRGLALAGVLVAVVGIGLQQVTHRYHQSGESMAGVQATRSLSTDHGEIQSFALNDGTTLTMAANTSVKVIFTQDERRVVLQKGKGLFEVVHDTARPFVVGTGETETRVLGTVFSVERESEQVSVKVNKGRVAVEQKDSDQKAELTAGQQVKARNNERMIEAVRPVDPETVIAFKTGRLVFTDETLENIVKELNRYSDKRITIRNAALKQKKASLSISKDKVEQALDRLAVTIGFRINRDLPDLVEIE